MCRQTNRFLELLRSLLYASIRHSLFSSFSAAIGKRFPGRERRIIWTSRRLRFRAVKYRIKGGRLKIEQSRPLFNNERGN